MVLNSKNEKIQRKKNKNKISSSIQGIELQLVDHKSYIIPLRHRHCNIIPEIIYNQD